MGYPKEILLIRHAENAAAPTNEHLAVKGYERAAALAYYLPDSFGTIDSIFSAGIGIQSSSKCSMETVMPLAKQLEIQIQDSFAVYEFQQMISHILSEDQYTDAVVVIAWEHTQIAAIATDFGGKNIPDSPWPEDCYDLVWKLTYSGDKSYDLQQESQLLLYGDQERMIEHLKEKSFCEMLQQIDPMKLFQGMNVLPAGNFPNNGMTCVFKVPESYLPEGLETQYIFVGAGFLLSETAIIDNQIAAVLNVAQEENDDEMLQIPFSDPVVDKRSALPFALEDHKKYYINQLAKQGLSDDENNNINSLIAVLYEMDRLLNFPTVTQQKENNPENFYAQGNLVIHCNDGGSRSVTATALYLYYKFYVDTGISFEEIYKSIIYLRWNESVNHHPTRGICETAYTILQTYETVFPEPIRK